MLAYIHQCVHISTSGGEHRRASHAVQRLKKFINQIARSSVGEALTSRLRHVRVFAIESCVGQGNVTRRKKYMRSINKLIEMNYEL